MQVVYSTKLLMGKINATELAIRVQSKGGRFAGHVQSSGFAGSARLKVELPSFSIFGRSCGLAGLSTGGQRLSKRHSS
jgi:hypothetical protein